MSVRLTTLTGKAILPYIDDLARLRMTVFREFPYLYDGEIHYEMDYLQRFMDSPNSVMIIAHNDKNEIVGASTACPMAQEMQEVKTAFIQQDRDPSEYFYFSESVLLPAYRNQGVGKQFLDLREKAAREFKGIKYITFCAVERTTSPPSGYHSPVSLWEKQGFVKHPELTTEFAWKEIGANEKTAKQMVFWVKAL